MRIVQIPIVEKTAMLLILMMYIKSSP